MKQYLDLLKAIKEHGTYKPAARAGMPGSQSLFGYQFRHNLAEGFPALTTKELKFKSVVTELLWFLKGDTNIKYLVDNGCNIWNEDAYNYYVKLTASSDIVRNTLNKHNPDDESNLPYPSYRMYRFVEFVNLIKNCKTNLPTAGSYTLGDCGYQYGKTWRNFGGVDQIVRVIEGLKSNPESRRHLVTAVDPAHDTELALYWCHSMFQFNCRPLSLSDRMDIYGKIPRHLKASLSSDKFFGSDEEYMSDLDDQNIPRYYLDCHLYQRSADVVLGVPFNIASYSLLTHIVAKICNMVPGHYIHSFGDVHIYDNHRDAVEEQISRDPGKLPEVQLSMNDVHFNSVGEVIQSLSPNDFTLVDYDPQPAIKAKLSTGLK